MLCDLFGVVLSSFIVLENKWMFNYFLFFVMVDVIVIVIVFIMLSILKYRSC